MSWDYVFFSLKLFFNVCECFGGLYVCAQHVCLVPEEVRRRHHISRTGVNELLWATVWVPRVKFRSSERQQVLLPAEPSFQPVGIISYTSLYCIPLPRSMMQTFLLCQTLPPSIDRHLKQTLSRVSLPGCSFTFSHDVKVVVTQSPCWRPQVNPACGCVFPSTPLPCQLKPVRVFWKFVFQWGFTNLQLQVKWMLLLFSLSLGWELLPPQSAPCCANTAVLV